jgi:UDP-N-acetylglucosamine/UDP-N-acetylgalactosamine diphosphorylase
MSIEAIRQLLPPEQADPLLRFWPTLIAAVKQSLLKQIQGIDTKSLKQQIALLDLPTLPLSFESFTDFSFSGNQEDFENGKSLIKNGKVGCIVLAGGQGTRLGFEGPKGLYPTSIIKHKSLFQLCFEKVLAAGKQAGRELSIAVMTSPENDISTKQFLTDHNFFGLAPNQVSFFSQSTLPLLDENGHLFLESTYKLSEGPDGNGHCFHHFIKAGIGEKWDKAGIQLINLILIDNPLADPFDAELIGYHHRHHVDITLKCTEKLQPDEKVGVLVKEKGHCRVIEYSELSDAEKEARLGDRLKHCCANLSLFSFSMSFIKAVVDKHPDMPLHKAWKAAKYVNEEGVTKKSLIPIAWKFEYFIFDLLKYATQTKALLYPRKDCFAPLKNYSGQDSISSVQQSLSERDRAVLQSITGLEPPISRFELAAQFYYPTPELQAKWKGRQPKTTYVDP